MAGLVPATPIPEARRNKPSPDSVDLALMLRFLAARMLKGVVVLFFIATFNFVLIRAAPGDPAVVMAGEAGAADQVFLDQLRARFGLDRPLPEQLAIYLKGMATLDLGFSYRQNRPVAALIAERLPATLLLTGAAFAISLALGIAAGALAAGRVGRASDSVITVLALSFYATPLFWIALMAQIVFSLKLGLLPNVGYETIGAGYTGLARALDIGHHLILPAMTLGLFFTALYARMMRSAMLETAGADFVRTARAKGVAEGAITRRHVARNAILPVVTLAGLQAGQIVGGAVLTETVFAWPGIGRLMFEALAQRDYQVLLGVFFVSSAMVVVFNLVTDLIYRLVDPRIEVAGRGGAPSAMTFLARFARNRGALIGLGLLLLVIAAAALAPLYFPQSPWRMVSRPFLGPLVNDRYLLGTDALGRDVMSGLMHGARVSLMLGLVSTVVALLIGVPLGAAAGYFGGLVDDLAMRFTELFQTIPSFALAIVIVAILQPSIGSIVLAIALVSWPPVARLVRGEVLSLRSRDYVLAARTLGQRSGAIIFGQVLPNTVAPVIVMASLMIASAILLESSLSFLGLGDPNLMTWGYMVGAGRTRLIEAWWISFFPGLAIFLTVLALNLVGEGLSDALNPRLAREGR